MDSTAPPSRIIAISFVCVIFWMSYLPIKGSPALAIPSISISSMLSSLNCHTIMARDAAGWHSRATPFEGSFQPTKADIVFIALRSTKVEPDGFTLALVEPNLAVDARGKVLIVGAEDFAAIKELARATGELPKTDMYRGQWRVKHRISCRPIDILQVTGQSIVSVYGWDKVNDLLEDGSRVGGFTKLPEGLQTLFGWINEARNGYERPNKDLEVIQKVRFAANADADSAAE